MTNPGTSRTGFLAGVGAAVLIVFALVGCGGGGAVSSTESKAEENRIALEELDYAEEHKNNYAGCVYAWGVKASDRKRGRRETKDEGMLRGAEGTCAQWRAEQHAELFEPK